MKIPFNQIWEVRNGLLTNKVKIRCGGITAHVGALKDYKGYLGGIDFSLFIGRELEVKTNGDTLIITGIY